MSIDSPKVFISHASEDKDRFVIEFARRLREKGIDAWVDLWEMLPGDSLIDKIFEDGIKNANAIIVVLSNASVAKPWVREELNASLIGKIERKTKIIPIVIDDCEVPQALTSTIWERIKDLESYDKELERVISAIFGHTQKPGLGLPPKYMQFSIDNLPGLNRIDTMILQKIGELSQHEDEIAMSQLESYAEQLNIPRGEFYESIGILEHKSLIEVDKVIGNPNGKYLQISLRGFEVYSKAFLPEFDKLINQTLALIINQDLSDGTDIAEKLNEPMELVRYVLGILENRGYIRVLTYLGGEVIVDEVTSTGRRAGRNL